MTKKSPTRQRRTISMSSLLALTFGGLVAVCVAAVLAFAVATNFKNTISLLDDKATMAIQALRFGLYMQLEPSQKAVEKVARLYKDGDYRVEDDAMFQSILVGMLIGRNDIEAVLIYDRNLTSRGIYRDHSSEIHEIEATAGTTRHVYNQLKAIKADDPPAWGPPLYIPSTQLVFMSVAAPLIRDGEIDGYLVAAMSTKRLSKMIADLAPEKGVAFILDGDNRLVAHSQGWALGLQALRTERNPTVDPRDTADPVLSGVEKWRPYDEFRASAIKGITVSEYRDDTEERRFGPPFVVMTAKLEGFSERPWTVGAYFAGNDINTELRRLWVSGVIGLIALVIAVLIAIWLARRIARPLARVSTQASRIATLDIEDVSDLPVSRVQEINTTAGAFNKMLEGLRAFTIYVPRTLVAKLVERGMADTTRSREARLTIMFTDIVGFTTLSESLSAQETADLLNRHFEILVACIEAEGGTVDKFLGDGLLAFWGAPDQVEHHADAALRAARAIGRAIAAENQKACKKGEPVIRLRIGIHSGPVIVGNIGTYERVNYTIVGDTVNVGQRIESAGRLIAPDDEICILASDDTIAETLDEAEKQSVTDVGKYELRGRSEPVRLWRVDSGITQGAGGVKQPEPADANG